MKSVFIYFSLALALSLGQSACQTTKISEKQICAPTDITAICLLEKAHASLDETIDSFSWVSGAAELAIAYGVTGNEYQSHELIHQAIERAAALSDLKQRGDAFNEILSAVAELPKTDKAYSWAQKIEFLATDLKGRAKAEIGGKAIVIMAVHGNVNEAYQAALNLPQNSEVEGYSKAITLRKVANILAKSGDLETADKAIKSITMSIDYYKSMARSDVARHAYKSGDKQLAEKLLREADPIARSLGNGYFVGAALRDIGYSYHQMGENERAKTYFTQALEATSIAEKQNEKARATSRIATRLSDAGLSEQTPYILNQAANFAESIESDRLKSYSYYEIAGAAGISGQFDLSRQWVELVPEAPMGSTSSIKSAAKRDLAWGLTRYGNTRAALDVVNSIKAERERIHALSRMIRVIQNPEMEALPRYL